ncbi:MAG: PAS domain S-box protein, partial [bacterium]
DYLHQLLNIEGDEYTNIRTSLIEAHNNIYQVVYYSDKDVEENLVIDSKEYPIVNYLSGRDTLYRGIGLNNEPVITYIKYIEEPGWYFTVSMGRKDLIAFTVKTFFTILIIAILIIIAVSLFIFWMYSRHLQERYFVQYTLEKEKRVLKDKYKQLFERALEMVIITDRQGRIIEFNDSAVRNTGYSTEELEGFDIKRLFKDGEFNEEGISRIELVRKDGSVIKADVSRNIKQSGEELFSQYIIRDMTESTNYYEKLQNLNNYLMSIIEASPNAVFDLDREGRIISLWNKGAENMLGWKAEEVIGKELPIVPENKTEEFHRALDSVFNGEVLRNIEIERLNKSGQSIHLLLNAAPVYDSKGHVEAVMSSLTDIMDMKANEYQLESVMEELHAVEKELRSQFNELEARERELVEKNTQLIHLEKIINNSPSVAITWELRDGWPLKFISSNTDAIGIDRGKIISGEKHYEDYIHPDDLKRVRAEIDRVNREGTAEFVHEYRIIDDDGKVRHIRDYNTVERDEAGNAQYINGIVIDVTDLKKMEGQLSRSSKLNAIGELAGGIAHDFNNLLAGIIGNAELLIMEIDSEEYNERLKSIIKIAKDAGELTHNLLSFARKGKSEHTEFDLNKRIDDAVEILGNTLNRNVRIYADLIDGPLYIDGDPSQIVNVFLNLGINAADAMPDGGELRFRSEIISWEEAEEKFADFGDIRKTDYVCISVKDTGSGMDDKVMDHIFEPFFTTKSQGRGTGLGLSSTYGIVKSHNGYISVSSEAGKGTEFLICMPVSLTSKRKHKPEKHELIKGEGNILFVDDEDIIRKSSAVLLNKLGYKTFIAADGLEAVDIFREKAGSIDLVILDMIMPGIGGRETFYKLKEIDPNIRVIISSGFSEDTVLADIMESGADEFIQKPFNIEKLSMIIKRVMDRKEQ